MMAYKSIAQFSEAELIIQKSRFIGQLYPVSDMEAAQAQLLAVKKQFWDARHHCSAMVLSADGSIMRSSDDGEPKGTAGVPILEVLKQNGLTNVLAVVTRYFGGILLGAGGLCRAYTKATVLAMESAQIVRYLPAEAFAISATFEQWNKWQGPLAKQYALRKIEYGANVQAELLIPAEEVSAFQKQMAAWSLGKMVPQKLGREYMEQLERKNES